MLIFLGFFRSSDLPQKNSTFDVPAPPEELQAFATDTGLADGVLLPHRPLELVWQAAKVKQFLGVSLNVLQLVDDFFQVCLHIDLFHRFRLLVFFLETPILL